MKRTGKSSGIPLDEIRLRYLMEREDANFALRLAVEEFEIDGELEPLFDTFRLVSIAQGKWRNLEVFYRDSPRGHCTGTRSY